MAGFSAPPVPPFLSLAVLGRSGETPLGAGWGGWVLALFLMLLVGAWLVSRRSVGIQVQALYRGLPGRDAAQIPMAWDRQVIQLPRDQRTTILERLAERMAQSGHALWGIESTLVRRTVGLQSSLESVDTKPEAGGLRRIAKALEARAAGFEELGECLEQLGEGASKAVLLSRCRVLQDTVHSQILLAERPSQLATLRTDLLMVERQIQEFDLESFFQAYPDQDLLDILDIIDQAGRLPGSEDRALYLGQALSRILTVLDRLAAQGREGAELQHQITRAALENIRLLLVSALENIRQRAELKVRLHSRILPIEREAVVVVEIQNVGEGHARNIFIDLEPDPRFLARQRRHEVRSLLRHQSARLEFLVEPQISDRVRLSFQITYDDLERQGNQRAFADMIEFRQTGAFRTFHPMRPNPYVVGRPLLPSDLFVGRENILTRIADSLRQPNPEGPTVVLVGSRRMGKTSVLRRLQTILGAEYVTVLVDLQGLIGSGETAFFRELTAIVYDELEEMDILVHEPPPEAFDQESGEAFLRFLAGVEEAIQGRRLVLMFDELEALEARLRNRDLEPGIVPYLGESLRRQTGVRLLLTGAHRLDELARHHWQALGDPVVYYRLDHLSRTMVDRLFVEPTADYFELDRLALDKVFQLAGGHPHFSQLLARELVEWRNQQRLAYITIQDVNTVADRVAEKGQLHITYLWEESSREQQVLLLALKELLDRKGMATLSAALRYLEQRGHELRDAAITLRQLVDRQILEESGGLLGFQMELLRLWLDRNHDAESSVLVGG